MLTILTTCCNQPFLSNQVETLNQLHELVYSLDLIVMVKDGLEAPANETFRVRELTIENSTIFVTVVRTLRSPDWLLSKSWSQEVWSVN